MAHGCDCLSESDDESFKMAQVVFIAKITSAELVPQKPEPLVRARFDVVETFKGNPEPIAFLEALTSESCAGFPLIVGEKYLFFVKSENPAFISSCGNNRRFIRVHEQNWLQKHKAIGPNNSFKARRFRHAPKTRP